TNPLSWNESNQLAKNHHKQTIVCNWQNKKLMICSIKRGHHPLTGKNNNDHQHNNSQQPSCYLQAMAHLPAV
ncbi:hypothetical protein ACQQ64_11695, partial [Corynebacterium diphtheriae]